MTTVWWTTFMPVLFFALFSGRLLGAHEGHTHVMGTVTAVNDGQLVVQTKGGQTVAIQLDPNTRYRTTGVATAARRSESGMASWWR
jgi:hypothetical protein